MSRLAVLLTNKHRLIANIGAVIDLIPVARNSDERALVRNNRRFNSSFDLLDKTVSSEKIDAGMFPRTTVIALRCS